MIFILVSFSSCLYAEGDYRSILFKEGKINISSDWRAINQNDCLHVGGEGVDESNYLKLCQYASSERTNYFFINDDGKWEAVTDGVPVLADINVSSTFTGMSATVSCRYIVGSRSAGFWPINAKIKEFDISFEHSRFITHAINGGCNADALRWKQTTRIAKILMD